MSVLTIGDRRFAAGLYWLERGSAASVARNARAFGRPWHVHWGGQTGYAADEEDPGGCPSLAASLQKHIGAPAWMALVEASDGRVALVKARDGAILADGDEVFPDRASALEAFERSLGAPWALHATAGLIDGDDPGRSPGPGSSPVPGRSPVTEIDPGALADEPAMRLRPAPLARLDLPKVGRFAALAAAVAGAALVWTQRDALWHLVAGPPTVAETEQVPVEPPVTVALDAEALLAGCLRALGEHPPYLPAWRTERIACEGRFADGALIGVRPELEDRAVLLVRWHLESGYSEPVHRRIAEAHLSGWYAASVTGGRAWAAVPLAPVVRLSDAAPPSLLEFREAVDRRLGTRVDRIDYAPGSSDGIEVRIATRRPPARLAGAVAGVPGLELVRLARDAAGGWRLEGRRVSPVSMPRSRYEQLAEPAAGPAAEAAAEPMAGPAAKPETQPATGSADDA